VLLTFPCFRCQIAGTRDQTEKLARTINLLAIGDGFDSNSAAVAAPSTLSSVTTTTSDWCSPRGSSGSVGVAASPIARTPYRQRAAAYHAGLPAEERARVHNSFMLDRTRVVCATVAFGMVRVL
jgi:hypothetical protein